MSTNKQIRANRQNAMKSTGPNSITGKMIAARNSTRHGFYSTNVLLPGEDPDELRHFARRLVVGHCPCGILEAEQVRIIIETKWRLQRLNLVEAELFQKYAFYNKEQQGVGVAFAHDASQANAFSKLAKYHGPLLRTLQLAEKELVRLQAVRAAGGPAVPPLLQSANDCPTPAVPANTSTEKPS